MKNLLLLALMMTACVRHVSTNGDIDPRREPDSPGGREVSTELSVTGAARRIVIDGLFQDWEAVPEGVADGGGDAGSGPDIGIVKLANDEERLFIYFEVDKDLELDWGHDLALKMSCGDDELTWWFGQRKGLLNRSGRGKHLRYGDLGLVAAPTVTSSRFEMSMERALLNDLLDCPEVHLRLEVAAESSDETPDGGVWLRYVYGDEALEPWPEPELGKAPGAVRLVTWNVLWSSILDPGKQDRFRRILQALDPDIICLQEIIEHDQVHVLINEWLEPDDGEWRYVGFSDRVILSRLPFDGEWPPTYQPLEPQFTVAGVRLADDRLLAIANAHLAFGSQDDERQYQVDSYIAWLRELMTAGGAVDLPDKSPFVLVGDLNFVGDGGQLETLVTGEVVNLNTFGPGHKPDWDGSDASDLYSLQTGAPFAATWEDPQGSYWPGKLDFVIYPDSVISIPRSFVLNTAALPSAVLSKHGLQTTDTDASDHLPVIADLVFE